MKIVYKYRIGQKVKIIKNDYYLLSDKKLIDRFVGKEVEIIERGFLYEDDSSHRRKEPKHETRALQPLFGHGHVGLLYIIYVILV